MGFLLGLLVYAIPFLLWDIALVIHYKLSHITSFFITLFGLFVAYGFNMFVMHRLTINMGKYAALYRDCFTYALFIIIPLVLIFIKKRISKNIEEIVD